MTMLDKVDEASENLAYLANASNLVLYLLKFMHFSPSSAANIVTNFMGTTFLLALLGGFLSDAFFNTYIIYLISAVIEFAGLVILTVQAHIPSLKARACAPAYASTPCQEIDGGKAAMLFSGLYLVALGVGGIKGSLPAHGPSSLTRLTHKEGSRGTHFLTTILSCGALIAVTFVVWIEDNKGWQWGYGISTAATLLSIPIFMIGSTTHRTKVPVGSPITTIFKVLAVAVYYLCIPRNPTSTAVAGMETSPTYATEISEEEEANGKGKEPQTELPLKRLKFLDRAIANKPVHSMLECSHKEVEEVKIVLKVLPIFMSTIMLNCCLAQLSTFSRIGTGIVFSIVAIAVAAVVEIKRKRVAAQFGLVKSHEPLPITFIH
ncbi:LOW QUALITY PROTEIN: Proton-dependent oligopeptide transporter family [Dillenia turbinata]|uniref:Proton-dependent oligopeptide transporter family n=1 Tax=Dillenia turbinata TaxID=194707 RepID=A0AAN8UPI4_9MAGN